MYKFITPDGTYSFNNMTAAENYKFHCDCCFNFVRAYTANNRIFYWEYKA